MVHITKINDSVCCTSNFYQVSALTVNFDRQLLNSAGVYQPSVHSPVENMACRKKRPCALQITDSKDKAILCVGN